MVVEARSFMFRFAANFLSSLDLFRTYIPRSGFTIGLTSDSSPFPELSFPRSFRFIFPLHFLSNFTSFLPHSVFFTPSEVLALYRRYMKLGGSKEEPISMAVALTIPELINNPFCQRIGKIYGEFKPSASTASEPYVR